LGKARVCLVTSEHISANPRLVKEADALCEADYDVRVVACQWQEWKTRADLSLLAKRRWRCHFLNWSRQHDPSLFWFSRLRHHAAKRLLTRVILGYGVAERAISRVIPELTRAAAAEPADLFIGHNIGALAAATIAARTYRARVGFDAEDFHSGMDMFGTPRSIFTTASEYIERRYLSSCNCITAASPGIADAYATKYNILRPSPILNVFPLSQRPQMLRPSKESDPLTLYWFSQTIGAHRGLEDVIQVMGLLRGCNIELHLRGNWQSGYREWLYQCAASAGLRPKQIVTHDPEPPDEMVRLAAQYDVGLALEQRLSKNRDICLTNKIFTYLLGGNAVLATATKGQRPVMEALGSAGFCYELGDVQALAHQLEQWYEDRAALQNARLQAWKWGAQRYNWDIEKGKFLHVIEEALKRPAKHIYEYPAGYEIDLGQSGQSRKAAQEDS
jgi:glycosyltransferase involved in cell wall biosynthesis